MCGVGADTSKPCHCFTTSGKHPAVSLAACSDGSMGAFFLFEQAETIMVRSILRAGFHRCSFRPLLSGSQETVCVARGKTLSSNAQWMEDMKFFLGSVQSIVHNGTVGANSLSDPTWRPILPALPCSPPSAPARPAIGANGQMVRLNAGHAPTALAQSEFGPARVPSSCIVRRK